MPYQLHPASFRDPDAAVIFHNDSVYRILFNSYSANFERLHDTGLYDELIEKNFLVKHSPASPSDLPLHELHDVYKIIKPETIPFISFPYEWTFPQIKKAALLTLEIQLAALRKEMSLKDATAFNVQFRGTEPVFIDTSSFEEYTEGKPWQAYGQFCRHFLGPLLLWSYNKKEICRLSANYIDGIPLSIVSYSLPAKTKFNFFILSHIHLHAKLENKHQGDTSVKARSLHLSKDRLTALLEHLKSGIQSLKAPVEKSEWTDYYNTFSYNKNNFSQKQSLVLNHVKAIAPSTLLDLGCNEGEFSILCREHVSEIVAVDFDPLVIKNLYATLEKNRVTNVLPLVFDFANPTPGIGINNTERESFLQRKKYDVVLALALIHHLTIGNNIPFENVASILSRIAKNLIIEFVPKDDSQSKRLLVTRKDIFTDYTLDSFKKEFSKYFTIETETQLDDSGRIIFRMKSHA